MFIANSRPAPRMQNRSSAPSPRALAIVNQGLSLAAQEAAAAVMATPGFAKLSPARQRKRMETTVNRIVGLASAQVAQYLKTLPADVYNQI
jgi:hypothetical protein